MANTFENTDLVVREMIDELNNSLVLANTVDRTLDTQFNTAEYGDTIRIRRPVYFATSDGAVVGGSDTNDLTEGTVSVTIDQRKKVVIEVSSSDLALELTDSRIQEYIRGVAHQLAQSIESSIATEMGTKLFNYVDATTGLDVDNLADADALMDQIGVDIISERVAAVTPKARRNMAKEISQNFSRPSEGRVTSAMDRAMVGTYSNLMVMQCQSIYRHTWGTYAGTPLVNGADQNVTYASVKDTYVQNLVTDGWSSGASTLNEGDIFTIDGVYQINRATKQSTGDLQQFVVDATVSDTTGAMTISISPPIIKDGQFQTVSAAPADNAGINVLEATGAVSNQNLAYLSNACELAMVELPAVPGAESSSVSDPDTGLSIRSVRDYDFTNDTVEMRFDVEYGVKVKNPWYGVRMGGV